MTFFDALSFIGKAVILISAALISFGTAIGMGIMTFKVIRKLTGL